MREFLLNKNNPFLMNKVLLMKFLISITFIIFLFAFSINANAQISVKYETAGPYTFTAPCGLPTAKVEAWGGGGRGGRKNSNGTYIATGGGGGGAYARADNYPMSGSSFAVTVGAGGNNTNIDGVNSSFGTLVGNGGLGVADADGYVAGSTATLPGADGGAASSGGYVTASYKGGNGGNGFNGTVTIFNVRSRTSGGGGSSAGHSANGNPGGTGGSSGDNNGGSAPAGGGRGGNGGSNGMTSGDPGSSGSAPGGGGGGATNGHSTAGAGARGQVYVTLNFPSPEISGVNSYNTGDDLYLSTNLCNCYNATYTWKKDGMIIPGATSSNLYISNLTFEDEGVYTVEVNIGTFTYSDATDVVGTSNGIIADSNNKTISGTLTSADFYVTIDEPEIKYYSETNTPKK